MEILKSEKSHSVQENSTADSLNSNISITYKDSEFIPFRLLSTLNLLYIKKEMNSIFL